MSIWAFASDWFANSKSLIQCAGTAGTAYVACGSEKSSVRYRSYDEECCGIQNKISESWPISCVRVDCVCCRRAVTKPGRTHIGGVGGEHLARYYFKRTIGQHKDGGLAHVYAGMCCFVLLDAAITRDRGVCRYEPIYRHPWCTACIDCKGRTKVKTIWWRQAKTCVKRTVHNLLLLAVDDRFLMVASNNTIFYPIYRALHYSEPLK